MLIAFWQVSLELAVECFLADASEPLRRAIHLRFWEDNPPWAVDCRLGWEPGTYEREWEAFILTRTADDLELLGMLWERMP